MERLLRTSATFAVLLLAWEIVAREFFPVYILPPPSLVARTLASLALDGTLWQNLQISLLRVLAGYFTAVVLAIPLGIAAGWWKLIDHTVGSTLELLRPLPALALIPLAIVWLGFRRAVEDRPDCLRLILLDLFEHPCGRAKCRSFACQSHAGVW